MVSQKLNSLTDETSVQKDKGSMRLNRDEDLSQAYQLKLIFLQFCDLVLIGNLFKLRY